MGEVQYVERMEVRMQHNFGRKKEKKVQFEDLYLSGILKKLRDGRLY
jgi:hypothetical protein